MENNPWISIWTKPRDTISAIVAEDPNRSLWPLSTIYGFSSLLSLFQSIALGQLLAPLGILILATLLAPFWGYLQINIWSWAVSFTGKWLKGGGSFTNIRASYAWSLVPMILNIPLWLLMVATFGHQLFSKVPDAATLPSSQINLIFGVLLAKVAVAVWSLVIYLNGLATVQKFTMLRTVGNVILAGIVVFVLFVALWTALAYLLGAH
jgi:hypothetical protein